MKAIGTGRTLLLVASVCACLAACKQPFGPRASIHDPGGVWVVPSSGFTPADGATTADTTPLLDWADVAGAAGYEVAIGTSAAGLDTATPVATTASEYQVPSALASATWYWRVRVLNEDGVAAAWSATWSLVVAQRLVAMTSVTGGTFQMGSTSGSSAEQPVHSVTVSSFLIGTYEVTQAQYQTVIGSNPSSFTGDTSRPVERVSWYNAAAFCNALSSREGLNPCYTIDGTTVTADYTKNGYRLPTEAEWEFAARGGASSQGYTYSGSNDVNAVAWYTSNAGSTPHPVGTKTANELGIYDMSGNVWEWCWDWYGSYGSTAATDPAGLASGTYRVLRGGSWDDDAVYVRCAGRNGDTPDYASYRIGFRVARRAD